MNFPLDFDARKFAYQVGLIGADDAQAAAFETTLFKRLAELGFASRDCAILRGKAVLSRERRAPLVAVYFGRVGFDTEDISIVEDLRQDSLVVIPVVDAIEGFQSKTPNVLHSTNAFALDALDHGLESVVTIVLQQFRLLRRERRLFVSYRRDDSTPVATDLYAALDSRQFDVFLDTNGVPPGEEFQDVLWHRLADSEIVVLLDTVGFSQSRWTQEELAKANATNIQILHLLWPGQAERAESAFSVYRRLCEADFVDGNHGPNGRLTEAAIGRIVIEVESLRARAIAARYRFLVDAFCDAARAEGLDPTVQADRKIIVKGGRRTVVVIPVTGVPNAQVLHDEVIVFPEGAIDDGVSLWAVFDERGLLPKVLGHLAWLNRKLPILAVPVFEVVERLSAEAA